MSRPVNRTALGAEENRPAPPSQQVSARPVTGPTPYRLSCSAFAPPRRRAAVTSCPRRAFSSASVPSSIRRYRPICCCPAWRESRRAGQPGQLLRPVRLAEGMKDRCALVEQDRVRPLHPRGVLAPQSMIGLQQRPALQHLLRRDPAFREARPG